MTFSGGFSRFKIYGQSKLGIRIKHFQQIHVRQFMIADSPPLVELSHVL